MCPKCVFVFLAGAGAMHAVHKIISVCSGQSPQYLGAIIWFAFTGFCLYRARNYPCGCSVQ